MQQKPHLMWEESDGLPRGSVSGILSSIRLYDVSHPPSTVKSGNEDEMDFGCL